MTLKAIIVKIILQKFVSSIDTFKEGTMKKRLLTLILIITFCIPGGLLAAKIKDPVGVLFNVQGLVEYSKDGIKWKKVRRNKFLFSGYQIKTGSDATGNVLSQKSGENFKISSGALIKITDAKIETVQGTMEPDATAGALTKALMKKFSKAQSYTTVRRAPKKELDLQAAREIVLCEPYPTIVWPNQGENLSYRLDVGDIHQYDVPATNDPIVRVQVKPFKGEQDYVIHVLENGEIISSLQPYRKRGKDQKHQLIWMDEVKSKALLTAVNEMESNFPDNYFMLGGVFEKEKMWVAALDQYQKYLAENPDEIEMKPYLFRVYKKLMLKALFSKELESFQKEIEAE
jgi:hypothetical protein